MYDETVRVLWELVEIAWKPGAQSLHGDMVLDQSGDI